MPNSYFIERKLIAVQNTRRSAETNACQLFSLLGMNISLKQNQDTLLEFYCHCTNFLLKKITSAVQTRIQKHSIKGKLKVKLSLNIPWRHILETEI